MARKAGLRPEGSSTAKNESPIDALKREAREEANCHIEPKRLVGIYCTPSKDDILLFMEAALVEIGEWQPNDEISEIGFFAWKELPSPMDSKNLTRIQDAFEGRTGVVRILDPAPGFVFHRKERKVPQRPPILFWF